ncbi:MAG TPA: hypothetical protein VFZ52_01585 [Chryseolinea sp.]
MKKNYTILIVLLCLFAAFNAAAHKRKKPTSCKDDAYSTEIIKEEQVSESCVNYEIKVSYDGSRTYGLSHYSLAIPCGEVKNLWNSEGWKMVLGKDRTTGVYGLKVDDINGFGDGRAESFTIKFTWCSSGSCIKDLGVVAYKYGQCVSYDTLNTEKPDTTQTCSTLLASLQKTNATCSSANDGQMDVVVQDGAPPFVYSWSNGANTSSAQNLAAGKYSVTIKDANGNVLTLSDEITSSPPIAITGTVLNPACSGAANGSVDVSATGGTGTLTYAWSNGSTEQDLSGVTSGVYTVKVTDAAGCFAEKSFALTNGALIAVQSSLTHPSCTQINGGIDITPTTGVAPYSYLWSNGSTTQDLQNVAAGNYTVKVTDALGCSVERLYTLRINNTLALTYVVTPTSCLGDNSGAINLTVSGGTAPYTIVWADGVTTEDRSGLIAGNYKVTVTDAAGCSTQLNISVFKKPIQVSSTVNQPKCSGEPGSIVLTPPPGGSYSYSWSNGETGTSIDDLAPGIYSVTITDENGCTTSLFFGIISPTPIEITGNVTNTQCGDNGLFNIDVSVIGGKFPYAYLWSNGATTQDLSGVSSGTHTVTITDALGCAVNKQFTIDPVSTNWSCLINAPSAPAVCKSAGNTIATGVDGATTYLWTVASSDNSWAITSGSSDSLAIYTAGNPGTTATFTLTITKNGCSQTCTYAITANGCVERDNTGGGDPTSSDPCTVVTPTPPGNPPVPPTDPEPEEPTHGCKPKVVKIYPNPFREKVNFEWTASKNDHVKLEIYDTRGKRIAVIYEGPVKAGKEYSFDWNANGNGCGKDKYYYYRFTSSKGVDTGRLVRK